MNRRKIKKQAKRFLEGKRPCGVHFVEEVDSEECCSVYKRVPTSQKFHRAVIGYIGVVCHWDSPYITEICFEDGEIKYGHSAQFC